MRNYVDDIVKNTVGQIKYRESITLGEIKTDNGDGTYGVEISQSGKTYPNVETAHYGDTFAIGEIAIITYEYGNKEMPRIWGHAKKIAQEPIEVEVDYSGSGGNPITTVTTLDAYSKTSNSAYLEGKIELSNGAGNCTRRGFKYGLTTAYGSDWHEDGDYEAGYFNKQITGLSAGETYHYKAYVLDADGEEQVGEDKIMNTVAVPILFEYYLADGATGLAYFYANSWWRGQTFTTTSAHTINYIELLLARRYDSSVPGTIYIEISKATVGDIPTGDILTSGETNGNTLPSSRAESEPTREWRKIDLTEYNLEDNTKYVITLHLIGGTSTHSAGIWNTGNLYSSGKLISSTNGGVDWSTSSQDCGFKIYGKAL